VDSNDVNLITDGTLTNYSVKEENQTNIQLTKTNDDMVILENVGAYNGTKNYTFTSNIKISLLRYNHLNLKEAAMVFRSTNSPLLALELM
jgi:hypothetical protein